MPTIEVNGSPAYQGEVQLLRWSDSNSNGMTVTLALNGVEEGDTHPFKGLGTGKHGQQFMAVLVPVEDTPSPSIDGAVARLSDKPEPREPARGRDGGHVHEPQGSQARAFSEMSRPQQAGILCADEEFQEFCGDQAFLRADVLNEAEPIDAVDAVRKWCGVKSRGELDGPDASKKWDALVAEFRRWQNEKRYGDMR